MVPVNCICVRANIKILLPNKWRNRPTGPAVCSADQRINCACARPPPDMRTNYGNYSEMRCRTEATVIKYKCRIPVFRAQPARTQKMVQKQICHANIMLMAGRRFHPACAAHFTTAVSKEWRIIFSHFCVCVVFVLFSQLPALLTIRWWWQQQQQPPSQSGASHGMHD